MHGDMLGGTAYVNIELQMLKQFFWQVNKCVRTANI